MRVVRTNFDRSEMRRDRRYAAPVFDVEIGGGRFRSINWSLGGLLLDGLVDNAGASGRVRGTLGLAGGRETMRFDAAIVRRDPASGQSALHFHEIGERGIDFLDGAAARRLH
jgi:hypothetical protein